MNNNYRLVTEVSEMRDYLEGKPVVAFDFETAPLPPWRGEAMAALDAHKAEICGVSLSAAPGTGIYVPLGAWGWNGGEVVVLLRDMVWENAEVVKVAHNIAFEAMFLYAHGIVLREPVYDTIAASQMTMKNSREFRKLSESGLKTLVPELLGDLLPTFSQVTGGRFFDELDPGDPETIRYACADSDYALRLYHLFNGWFDQWLPRHRWLVEHVESPAAVYAGIMKFNGVPADEAGMRRKLEECGRRLSEIRDRIQEITGPEVEIGANCGTKAFRKYLYETLKLPVFRTTETNAEAADEKTMQTLAEWCGENRPELSGLFELAREYRKTGKLKATYLEGYLEYVNPVTGRIHPDMLPLATETGRFACRHPNMQNCPRKANDSVGIRNCIRAPEGRVLLSCDMSQIELRVGAFYCRDPKMLAVYREDGDIHAQTTSVIYGISCEQAKDKEDPDYKERRTVAKGVNFGLFYGLSPKGLQDQLRYGAGISRTVGECEAILRNIRAGYPKLAVWQEETKRRAGRLCYTETFLGRRRYLPGIRSGEPGRRSFAERQALNTPIQGTAADILKLAMGRVLAGLGERPWLRPVLQIHDELVFEIPEERVREAAAFVRECMEKKPFPEMDVVMRAEATVGRSFGEMGDYDERRSYLWIWKT